MRIAAVGIGAVLPGCPDLEAFRLAIEHRTSMSEPVPPSRWAIQPEVAPSAPAGPDQVLGRNACLVRDWSFDSDGLSIASSLLEPLDTAVHFAIHAARGAWRDAVTDTIDPARVGVILGNIVLPTERASELCTDILAPRILGRADSGRRRTELASINRYVAGMPAGLVAQALGFGGGSFCLDAACASSLYALKLACDELEAQRADAMLAGGVSRPDALYTQMGFSQLRALSPSGRCAPFDGSADGLVVGEGCGIVVLKRLEDALDAGDRILAVIRGIGLANDLGAKLMQPESEGQLRALKAAYVTAGWRPGDVDLIEAHGTGTPLGDRVEFESLCELWRDEKAPGRGCVLGSVKANIGHLLTAAGAAGLIKLLLAMQSARLPPATHFDRTADAIDLENSPFDLPQEAADWGPRAPGVPRRAALNAFGFGGINAHVLLEEWQPEPAHRDPSVIPLRPRDRRAASERPAPVERPEPVVILGIGACAGPWPDRDALGQRLLGGDGDTYPAPPRHWWGVRPEDPPGFYIDTVSLDVERFHTPPAEIEEMLAQQLLMLQVAAEALEDAGIDLHTDPRASRTGVYVGVGLDLNTVNYHMRWTLADELEPEQAESDWLPRLRDAALPALTANRTMGGLASIVASRLARTFRVGGPSFAIAGEEVSGLHALRTAVHALKRDEIDIAIVGAVDLSGDPRAVQALLPDHAVSPDGVARPFDRAATGRVPADGAVALVLQRRDTLTDSDGYAQIIGLGKASGPSLPAGVARIEAYHASLARALEDAACRPAALGYFEAHGSAMPAEDAVEAAGLSHLYAGQPGRSRPMLGSSKGDIGHCGAAGALFGVLKASLCLHHRTLTPLRGASDLIDGLEDPALREQACGAPRPWLRDRVSEPRVAAVASMGVDGSCAHAVLQEVTQSDLGERVEPGAGRVAIFSSVQTPRSDQLVLLRRPDSGALLQSLRELKGQLSRGHEAAELARIAWQESAPISGRATAPTLALLGHDAQSLGDAATQLEMGLQRDMEIDQPGAWFTPAPLAIDGALTFVFPGVGNHYPGMGQALGGAFPRALERLDRQNERLRSQFAQAKFWSATGPEHASAGDFILAHVWIGALVSDVLAEFGVRPDACVGYSLGETTALIATRAWRARDELLRRLEGSPLFNDELAPPWEAARRHWQVEEAEAIDWQVVRIEAPAADVRRALAHHQRAYLLIINSPRECVIGGDARAVRAVADTLGRHPNPVVGVTSVHCPVAHSVVDAYRSLHRLPTDAPDAIRFYRAARGDAYVPATESAADAITELALDTIDFPRIIERAYADGARVFVESGPGRSMGRMLGDVLGERPYVNVGVCANPHQEVRGLLETLGALAAQGVDVRLDPLFAAQPTLASSVSRTGTWVTVRAPGADFEPPAPRPRPSSHPAPATPLPSRVAATALSPLLSQMQAAQVAGAEVHRAFLNLNQGQSQAYARTLAFQHRILAGSESDPSVTSPSPSGPQPIGTRRTRAISTAPKLYVDRVLAEGAGAEDVRADRSGADSARAEPAPPRDPPRILDRAQCLEFAIGRIGTVFGPRFADVDAHPTRVRLPDEPLMLVDRVLDIEGEPNVLGAGRIVTEHDVHADRWYLDGGRMPTAVAVESGQADLMLSGFLGIDHQTGGLAVYRLLDAEVAFHGPLPGPGATIRYDIRIQHFFRQGATHLFRFEFDATVDGAPLLTMRNGCAGFFTQAELDGGQGLVGPPPPAPQSAGAVETAGSCAFVPLQRVQCDDAGLERLRTGDLAGCFGAPFDTLPLRRPMGLPSGRLTLVHRIIELDPTGGYGLGRIVGEADIRPDDWFLTCHFVDDRVMPGTLMYECCLHTLRVFLLRLGWVGEVAEAGFEPLPGVTSSLKCRGQVTPSTRQVRYEILVRHLGFDEHTGAPYAIADAIMHADGRAIVLIRNLSARARGLTRESLRAIWTEAGKAPTSAPSAQSPPPNSTDAPGRPGASPDGLRPPLFDEASILAFATGNPSDAFGPKFRPFDRDRKIARLPGPPYQFLERVTELHDARTGHIHAGARVVTQYPVPEQAWYFAQNRQAEMPYAILLEVALQPCGWLAAYLGTALTSSVDLRFRNLGGRAVQHRTVYPRCGVLTADVTLTRVSESAGMTIMNFDFALDGPAGRVFSGDTYFGFFSAAALANQVGIRGACLYEPDPSERARGLCYSIPNQAPFPDGRLRMVEEVELLVDDGGPHQAGFVRGGVDVSADAWFFAAHFHQDPVWPGSLGLESMLQLLKQLAHRHWGSTVLRTPQLELEHRWEYRGQILPTDTRVTVEAIVKHHDPIGRTLVADGMLSVDGRIIYSMQDFSLVGD